MTYVVDIDDLSRLRSALSTILDFSASKQCSGERAVSMGGSELIAHVID